MTKDEKELQKRLKTPAEMLCNPFMPGCLQNAQRKRASCREGIWNGEGKAGKTAVP